jgi:hypothetical protein
MSYRLAGYNTELCSCDAPCPCAFGQTPTGGRCEGMFAFHFEQGEVEGVDVSGTKAILAAVFEGGPWTNGNFTAALILDANATEEQRSALARALGGELGGDAGGLAQLIGDMKGVFVAPIDYRHEDGEVEVRAGDLAAGAGATLKNVDGSAEIEVTNACYPIPNLRAGKSLRAMINVEGLSFDHDGSGMWTGPFVLSG